MAVSKVFRIELVGGDSVKKIFEEIKQQARNMANALRAAKKELSELLKMQGDPDSIAKLKTQIASLTSGLKSLSTQRKTVAADAEKQAKIENELAQANLRNATATKRAAEAEAIRAGIVRAANADKQKQIDLENKNTAAINKSKTALSGLATTYAGIRNAIAQIKPLAGTSLAGRELAQDFLGQFSRIGSLDILKKQISDARAEVDKLKQKNVELRAEMSKVGTSGAADLKKLETQLGRNNKEIALGNKIIREAEANLNGVARTGTVATTSLGRGFSSLRTNLLSFTATFIGFQAAFRGLQTGVQNAKALSDATTNLEILLGKAEGGADRLVASLAKLNTRTKLVVLEDIAAIASRAGVAEENLAGVTKAIDIMQVAFGKDFGPIDTGTETFVKLINIFFEDGQVTEERMLKVANAVRTIANESVATVPFIADFSKRMAGLKQAANISLPDVIGLGAGLEEFGQSAEVAGTVFNKIIPLMGKNLKEFAQVAGLAPDLFKELVRTNPFEAILRASEGFVAGKDDIELFSKSLQDTGIEAGRAIQIIATLGGKADTFRERMARAGTAIQETSSITQAFNQRNENLAALLDKISKKFADAANQKGFKDLIVAVSGFFLFLLNHIPLVVAAFGAYIGVQLRSALITAFSTKQGLLYNAMILAQAAAIKIAEIASLAWSGALKLIAPLLLRARAAIVALGVAMRATPFGIILTVIGGLVIATAALAKSFAKTTVESQKLALEQKILAKVNEEVAKQISQTIADTQLYTSVIADHTLSLSSRQQALQALIAIAPDYLSGLTLENAATKEGKDLLDAYIVSLKEKIRVQATQDIQRGAIENLTRLEKQLFDIDSAIVQLEKDGESLGSQSAGLLRGVGTRLQVLNGQKDEVLLAIESAKLQVDAATDFYKIAIKQNDEAQALLQRSQLRAAINQVSIIEKQIAAKKELATGFLTTETEYTQTLADIEAKEKELVAARVRVADLNKTIFKPVEVDREPILPEGQQFVNELALKKRLVVINKTIEESRKLSNLTKDQLELLIKEKEEIKRLLKQLSGDDEATTKTKAPKADKLDPKIKNAFKLIEAERDKLIAEDKESLEEGQLNLVTTLENERDFRTKSINDKLKLLRKFIAANKTANEEEIRLEQDLVLEKSEINEKTDKQVFDIKFGELEAREKTRRSIALRSLKLIQADKTLSNVQQLEAEEEFFENEKIAIADANFEERTLRTKFNQESLAAEDKMLKKVVDNLTKLEAVREKFAAATLQDIRDEFERQSTGAGIALAVKTNEILNSKKNFIRQSRELDDERAKYEDFQLKNTVERLTAEFELYKFMYAMRIISTKEFNAKWKELLDAQNRLFEENAFKGLSTTERFVKGLKALGTTLLEKTLGIKKYTQQEKDNGQDVIDALNLTAQKTSETITAVYDMYFRNQQQKIEDDKEFALEAEDRQKERRLSLAQSEDEKQAIEKDSVEKRRRIEKNAGEEQRKLALKKITIDFGVALIKTFAQFGFPLGLIPAAALTALYLVQRGAVASQKFSRGGKLKKKPIYEDGGVTIVDRKIKKIITYAMGGKPKKKDYETGGITEDTIKKKITYEYGGKPDMATVWGGKVKGRKHEQGGNPFVFKGRVFEDEVDELNVIRTKNAPRNKRFSIQGTQEQIASALNAIGGGVQFQPGAQISKLAMGTQLGTQLTAPNFSASQFFTNNSSDDGAAEERMKRLEKITEEVLNAVYASDMKKVVLDPNQVTKSQIRKQRDVSVGTI